MRRVRRRGANKEKVFGCDLLEHLTTSCQEIPVVLRNCSEFVEQNGVVDGIYRLSGVSSNIQKLRAEFESDGPPDLNKDVYLQDIHCVSSLCKAYFRELPNPLLTYQLYDKFAEAVAIQLEEERLVKIRDVLKELPAPHYRTLEFLMHHLVRMASYSSETNMHARNLAIVWAPNLLRSKDIEASGFNGTAAFMEVRVQSIVVEFILTHVPQLFPQEGVPTERRKSLPSPSAMPNPELAFFKSSQPNFGNISPGDGPLPIRPYHAIIEGTDKRKGSLKGRKWMSIFNIKERFPDPRRKHKQSAKEKEKTSLRPARSMDSLSTPSYPNEGPRRSGPRPPSISMSPDVTSSTPSASDIPAPSCGISGSEYAVTYRRGTGLVSGSAGTQGIYTALDPDGLGIPSVDGIQTRSPGLSSKAGRRAAMHITGPTLVTVPLHITSNLALGVLQGGGGDRVVHRGREKDGGDKLDAKEEGERKGKRERRGMEWNVEEPKKVEERKQSQSEKEVDSEGKKEGMRGGEEEGDKEVLKGEGMKGRLKSNKEEDKDEYAVVEDQDADEDSEYMVMKGTESAARRAKDERHHEEDGVFDSSDILNSTEVENDNYQLSGYIEDNFEFLDQMDCSVMDHMDCSVSYQVNEFSVEPPGHSDDEYEVMNQSQSSQSRAFLSPDDITQSPMESNPHRPLSFDLHSRHTKSLSLPYMTSPIQEPGKFCSEDELSETDGKDNDYSSEDAEDESMFVKSLPPDFFLNTMARFEPDATNSDTQLSPISDLNPAPELQGSGGHEPSDLELPACDETTAAGQKEGDDEDGLDGEQIIKTEDEKEDQQLGNDSQSKSTEKDAQSENSPTSEAPTSSCVESSDEDPKESNAGTEVKVEAVLEAAGILPSDSLTSPCAAQKDSGPLEESKDTSVILTQQPEICVKDDPNEQSRLEEHKDADDQSLEQDIKICRTSGEIWSVLEEVVCGVLEDEEDRQEEDLEKDGEGGEQAVDAKGEKSEPDQVVADTMEDRIEEKEPQETNEGKLTDGGMKEEINISEKNTHENSAVSQEEEDGREGVKDTERDESRTQAHVGKQPPGDLKENNKCENSDDSLGGVGRKLVVFRQPKIYQVKAVPVVPPKPQHCRITALTLRQQQQRERGDNALRVPAEPEQARDGDGDNERPARRRDGVEGAAWDTKRNSPLSMCFDEAVAIATMRREKERVRDGEAEGKGEVK
ncbi:rho GTPase-activating protein 30 [Nothobranchius furzeri]|uniref:Rho GTPase-activating protein 30-like n=4 Tax=Nothobranchius TaxID=28779 RepID=A0A9D2YL50_NOTFU|nr:rho GTPase-activating protein 30 [Nothobranchius furzeri]XP_054598892.1 rho GTPase-activating protein 30 [Nothobranchius furzeri]KAF7221987.1 rho GTPase-activating protein 30-like [Nothobranchius furzeri]